MSMGCVPMAYDVPSGSTEIIGHGKSGLLVPLGDIRAWAEHIRKLHHNRELLNELSKGAIDWLAPSLMPGLWLDGCFPQRGKRDRRARRTRPSAKPVCSRKPQLTRDRRAVISWFQVVCATGCGMRLDRGQGFAIGC